MSGSTADQALQQHSEAEKVTRPLSSVTPSRTCLLVLCATILGVALGSCKRVAVGAQWVVVEREHKMGSVQPIAESFWSVVEGEFTVVTLQQMAVSFWATSCGALLLAAAAVALAAWCIYVASMQHLISEHANEAFAWDALETTKGRPREIELGHMGLLAAWECFEKAVSSNCSTEEEATSEHCESSSEDTLTFAELESTVNVPVAPAESRAESQPRLVGSSTAEAAAAVMAAAEAAKAEAVECAFHSPEIPEVHTSPHAVAGVFSAANGPWDDHGDKVETHEADHGDKVEMQDEAEMEEGEEEKEQREPGAAMAKTAKAHTAAASTLKLAAEDKEDEQVGSELTPAGKLSEPTGEMARPIMANSPDRLPSSSLGIRWSDCPADDPAECEEPSSSRSSASRNAQRPPGVWHQEPIGSELVTPVVQHNHSPAWPAYAAVPIIDYSLYGYPCAMPDPAALGHASQFFGTPMMQCRMPNSWGRTDIRQHGSAAAFSSSSAGASPRQNRGRAASQDSDGGAEDLPCKKSSLKNDMSMQEIMETLSGVEETRVVIARRIKQLGLKSGPQLRRHFQKQGAVEGVLVSHSHLQTRVRPASMAFAIMATEEGAKAVLAQGSEQVVSGVTITLNAFRRPSSTRDSQTGLENDSEK